MVAKGVVTYVGPYDETIPDRTYKVRFEHGAYTVYGKGIKPAQLHVAARVLR